MSCGRQVTSLPVVAAHRLASLSNTSSNKRLRSKGPYIPAMKDGALTNRGFHETHGLRIAIFSDFVGDRRQPTRAEEPSTKGTPNAYEGGTPRHRHACARSCVWLAPDACIAIPPAKPVNAIAKRRVAVLPRMAVSHSTSVRRLSRPLAPPLSSDSD
jgi:hypothetical protein